MWEIIGEAQEIDTSQDGRAWAYTITPDGRKTTRTIWVRFDAHSSITFETDPHRLGTETMEAFRTQGKSYLQTRLSDSELPRCVTYYEGGGWKDAWECDNPARIE